MLAALYATCSSVFNTAAGEMPVIKVKCFAVLNVSCMGGTSFVTHEKNELELQCLADGTWSPSIPTCWSN